MKKIFFIVFALSVVAKTALCQAQGPFNTVSDIDGNVYNIITIGGQRWLEPNLKTTRFRGGSAIPEMKDSAAWRNAGLAHKPAWCYYGNNTQNNAVYGKLYNWYAAADTQHLCPTGWHLPSDAEFEELTRSLGGYDVAGGHLKTVTLWSDPNSGADNSSGFSAVPAGLRFYTCGFYALGDNADFWTSSGGAVRATNRSLFNDNPSADHFHDYKDEGFSVRCVGN